jgi:hypothetical protein
MVFSTVLTGLVLKFYLTQASWMAQFRALSWRSWLALIKEPLLVRVRLLQSVVRIAGQSSLTSI